jgi:hypothetical protein
MCVIESNSSQQLLHVLMRRFSGVFGMNYFRIGICCVTNGSYIDNSELSHANIKMYTKNPVSIGYINDTLVYIKH